MKKNYIILIIAFVLGITSCDQKPSQPMSDNGEKQTEQNDKNQSLPELGFVEDGQLKFYDVKNGETKVFSQETDSIVDAVCTTDGIVYYNVFEDNHLMLKCLDLKANDPKPESLAEWKLESSDEDTFPLYGNMYLNKDQNQVALQVDITWFAGPCCNLAVYDCDSKTIDKIILYQFDEEHTTMDFMDEENLFEVYAPAINFDTTLFDNSDGLYYLGNDQRICLNDKINDSQIEEWGFEEDYYYYYPIAMDPTGEKMLFGSVLVMGDGVFGYFAVSSLDGKEQFILPNSDVNDACPQWLKDGSLVYIGWDDKAALHLMDSNYNIRPISRAEKFFVLP